MAKAWKQVLVDSLVKQRHVSLPAHPVVQTLTHPAPVCLQVRLTHLRATQVRNQIAMHLPIPISTPPPQTNLHTAGANNQKG
jgi:hypothetical protein